MVVALMGEGLAVLAVGATMLGVVVTRGKRGALSGIRAEPQALLEQRPRSLRSKLQRAR